MRATIFSDSCFGHLSHTYIWAAVFNGSNVADIPGTPGAGPATNPGGAELGSALEMRLWSLTVEHA